MEWAQPSSYYNIAKDKTELIEDKDIKYNIGDKCRIKTDTKLFDKMKRKYSAEIYTIIKVNKNTVDIENDEVELDGVKKNWYYYNKRK